MHGIPTAQGDAVKIKIKLTFSERKQMDKSNLKHAS